MKQIKCIYDREFESYFRTLYGYIFTAFILLVAGIYVTVNSLKNGSAAFELTISNMTFIYLVAIPLLAMRVFSEERKQKTEQLLYSLPVKMSQVVLGKFFALCTVLALPLAVMILYPLGLSFFGAVDLKAAYCALFGFFALGCCICSICMFLSSLTDSQAVAAGTGFAAVLLLFFLSTLAGLINSSSSVFASVLRNLSPFDRYYSFLNGVFDVRSLIYMLALQALFIVLTVMVMEGRRRDKKFLYYSIVIVLTLAIISLSDVILGKLPSSSTKLEMNSVGITDFSVQTENQLAGLNKDVSIYWITRDGKEDTYIEQTLDKFDELSSHVNVIKIDPIQQPRFANKYTTKTVNENSLIVECGSESKYIDYSDIYKYSENENVTRADFYAESLISNAINYVTDSTETNLYILSGHGEEDLSETFMTGLKNCGYNISTLDLLSKGSVPENCSCLFVASTPSDLTDDEASAVMEYLTGGGKLLLFSTYLDDSTPNWVAVLKQYGLNPQPGIVVEGNANYYVSGFPYYLIPDMHENEVTEDMIAQGQRVITPLTQSAMPDEILPVGVSVELILSTSDAAYAKADGFNMKTYAREEGDLTGKFIVGISATKEESNLSESAVVWYPSAYILADAVNTSVSGGNLQLLLNSISYLTDSAATATSSAKHLGGGTLVVNSGTSTKLSTALIAVIPLAFLIGGIITVKRRKVR